MKRSTNYPIHWFIVFLFTISISWGQIKTSTTLDEAIHKALEKSLSQKNKELEIEKLNLQEKGIWNKYIPTVEASAIYSYFDNKLTVDLPTTQIPIINYPLFDGKTPFDNYGNIFNGSIMANQSCLVVCKSLMAPKQSKKKPKEHNT